MKNLVLVLEKNQGVQSQWPKENQKTLREYCNSWIFGFRFNLFFTLVMLVLRWLRWYFVGSVGISLIIIPSRNVDGK